MLLVFWGGRGRDSGCDSCATTLPSAEWRSTPTGQWPQNTCCRTWIGCFLSIHRQRAVPLLLPSARFLQTIGISPAAA